MAFKCPPELLLRGVIRSKQPGIGPHFSSAPGRTFKAAVVEDVGKPLLIKQLPQQPLRKGQVRIGIHSAAINFADILISKGQYQEKPPLPFVPGSESAGEILELGPEVSGFSVGDKVLSFSPAFGYAEQKVGSCEDLIKLPKHVSTEEASATMVSYCTAWAALKNTANVQPGETVLVTAAAGAVGLAAVDLAANVIGAKVIGAAGGVQKCRLVQDKGAEATVDYSTDNIREKVMEVTKGRGADVILDAVGGKVFEQCLRSISFQGRIVVIGFASGVIPKIPAGVVLVKSISIHGIYWGSYKIRKPQLFKQSIETCLSLLTKKKKVPTATLR